jgi:hypothetical protein
MLLRDLFQASLEMIMRGSACARHAFLALNSTGRRRRSWKDVFNGRESGICNLHSSIGNVRNCDKPVRPSSA